MEQKTKEADQIVEYFKQQVLLLKEKALLQASLREEKKLLVENAKLKKDIDDLKKVLLEKQKRRTAKQVAPPSGSNTAQCTPKPASLQSVSPPPLSSAVKSPPHRDGEGQTRKAEKRGERRERRQKASDFEEPRVDVSRLDIRVGRIVSAVKHLDADSLFVQEVDVGEDSPRTVVSGLMKHVPLEEMQNRMAVFLCNLRPSRMRGVVSEAMMLCATSSEKVEILEPPGGAIPGDRVTIQSFSGEPDKELNPKKKVWEQAQADMRTDARCVATYKGAALEVRGKGFCKAPTMSNCGIK